MFSAELERSQPFAVALLRTLINTNRNNRHEELKLIRWWLNGEGWFKWTYDKCKGYLLKCYKISALLHDSQDLVNIVHEYDGYMRAS